MGRSVAIAGTGVVVLGVLAALGWAWFRPWGGGGAETAPSRLTPEQRTAHEQALVVARKEGNPSEVNAQDWAETQSMLGNADYGIRVRGLNLLGVFKDTAYEQGAWEAAVRYLAGKTSADRVFATNAVAALRPKEAPRYIAPLLEDRDPDVRKHAQDILSRLGYSAKSG